MEKQKNIPHLRFPEFKGEWENEKLGEISTVSAGGTPSTIKSEYWNGNIRWMNSGELNLKRVIEVENRITKKGLENSSTKLLPKYCVLIGLAGQGKTRGTIAMNMIELCTNQSIASIYPNSKKFDSEFLYHNLDNRYEELRKLSTGDGGRGGLNLQIIKSLKIFLPSGPEQKRIASFFTVLDKKIKELKQKKVLVEEYKKGLMQKIFSQELRFKDNMGNEFPNWEKKNLGEVGKFISGTGFTDKEQGGSSGIPFLKVSDMNLPDNKIVIKKSNNYVSEEQVKRMKYKVLASDALIFAKVGAAIFLERKRIAKNFLIDNNMMAFIPGGNIYFFYHLFNNIRLSKFVQVGALPSYNSSDLAIIDIFLPSEKEQIKITKFLSAIDEKLNRTQMQIEKTEHWKKGLLQKMFC